jgi:hypothetical protein
MYATLGQPTDAVIYSTRADLPDWKQRLPGVDVEFLSDEHSTIRAGEKSSVAPPRVEPYVIPAGEGERMVAGDMLFAFLTDGRQSGGKFIALMSDGRKDSASRITCMRSTPKRSSA